MGKHHSKSGDSSGDTPEHVAHLGKLDVHIKEEASKWSESAIRVNFTSESDWLLTPDKTGFEIEPSAADKVVAMIKRGLMDTGIDVIDDRAPDMGLGYGKGGGFRNQLQTDTMHSFHHGDNGILIRAKAGQHRVDNGIFNAEVIATEANKIVDRLAYMLKDTHASDPAAQAINEIYDRMELHRERLDDLLPKIPNPHGTEELHSEVVAALMSKLPAGVFKDAQNRTDAVAALAKGLVGTDDSPAWEHTRNEEMQGGPSDPLNKSIAATLQPYVKEGTTPAVLKFITDEACEAAYGVMAGNHASYPSHG